MHRTDRWLGGWILAAAIVAPIAGAGCTARLRIYDAEHRDYHRWDDREDHVYRRYYDERRIQYREFSQLNEEERREYWRWRHDHPETNRR